MAYSRSYARPSRDDNHRAIVLALETVGAFVIDLSAIGGGVPDLIVFRNGATHLMEVKNPESHGRRPKCDVPHHEMLTDEQVEWLALYAGKGPPVRIVTTTVEALAHVCATQKEIDAAVAREDAR